MDLLRKRGKDQREEPEEAELLDEQGIRDPIASLMISEQLELISSMNEKNTAQNRFWRVCLEMMFDDFCSKFSSSLHFLLLVRKF